MYSMIMAAFDGATSMMFGFGTMPAPDPASEPSTEVEEASNKAYGYDAERPTRGTRLVERMDGDGDGGLSWAELGENRHGRRIARNFDKIDNDGNGSLTAAELDSFRQSRTERMVARMDSDGDGGLSWNELGETRKGRRIAGNFDKIDNDGDGKLTAAELTSFREARHHAHWGQPEVQPAQHQTAVQPGTQETPAVPAVEAPTEAATPNTSGQAPQTFFFAMYGTGTGAQQASASYNDILALFQ